MKKISLLHKTCFIFSCLSLLTATQAYANDDYLQMSLEELMEVPVYSASKKIERVKDTAAAVYVISADDIARSTANSIPELLRMAPGVQVARVSANVWSVSIRGFNGRFSNKLLVLIDGRTVYHPLFSGVFWNTQDTMLEDVERIEIIRGPGGALWGANAVNGVINIITKSSKDTDGLLVSAGGGSEDLGVLNLRFGQSIDELSYRVFAKAYKRDSGKGIPSGEAFDETEGLRFGFRSDWQMDKANAFQFQGELYSINEEVDLLAPTPIPPFATQVRETADHEGGSILSRWTHDHEGGAATQLQFYYDKDMREEPLANPEVNTFDVEAQHRFQLNESNEVSFGFGFRHIDEEVIDDSSLVRTSPEAERYNVLNLFLQDQIQITESIKLILGAKLSHNEFSHEEIQPNVRGLWQINDKHSVWAAVSRAVRTPTRTEQNLTGALSVTTVPDVGPVTAEINPNEQFDAEELIAYEIGYRAELSSKVQFDLSTFYFDYDNLNDFEMGELRVDIVDGMPSPVTPLLFQNALEGKSYGAELLVDLRLSDTWRMQAAYGYLKIDLSPKAGSMPVGIFLDEEAENPNHQASIRSLMDLPHNMQFDGFLRYVDRLERSGVDSYIELDLRLGWRPTANLKFDIIGNNLLESEHQEFSEGYPTVEATQRERAVFAKVTWEY